MSSKSCTPEEKFPLLLLFLEDGQRSSKQHKKIMIDKGRYLGIASGASNVITQWPGQVASCWVTAMLIGLSIILVSIVMITFAIHPGIQNLTAKCKRSHAEIKNDSSIVHLVHGPNRWTKIQLNTLEQIAQSNPQQQIQLILIHNEIGSLPNIAERDVTHILQIDNNLTYPKKNDLKRDVTTSTSQTPVTQPSTKKIIPSPRHETVTPKLKIYGSPRKAFEFSIGAKKMFQMFIKQKRSQKTTIKPEVTNTKAYQIRTLWDIVKIYSNIKVINTSFEEVFKNTPLYYTWQNTNMETRLFAIRILQLWNFAGISFSLASNEFRYLNVPENNSTVLKSLKPNSVTTIGVTGLRDLPAGLVTVDDEGLRMETKTTCHAFFGEILIGLTKATPVTKPSDLIRETLQLFCSKAAVDAKYCDEIRG
ncbi:hypothetical protein RI129_009976 [Pyrocoelia pectoralis]|uniref:Uncharacterized protein n=1 Tax=Pyrocoelia pectoralis TaxID=417401 RepID=A0AAN7VCL6_9COLE